MGIVADQFVAISASRSTCIPSALAFHMIRVYSCPGVVETLFTEWRIGSDAIGIELGRNRHRN